MDECKAHYLFSRFRITALEFWLKELKSYGELTEFRLSRNDAFFFPKGLCDIGQECALSMYISGIKSLTHTLLYKHTLLEQHVAFIVLYCQCHIRHKLHRVN